MKMNDINVIDKNYIMQPYDDLLVKILTSGEKRSNRDGTPKYDTYSLFGEILRFDVRNYFPLLTKRKIYPKSIWAELLWMLSGSTNINDLEKLGSKIWTPWKSIEFEVDQGYSHGEIGPSYGWSFRYFGGTYSKREWRHKHNWFIDGVNQVQYVIDELNTYPYSRRAIISLWNARELNNVRLPWCHIVSCFNLRKKGLACSLHIRSSDVPIGLPANIQFYTTLLYMIAQQVNMIPYQLVVYLDDAHIYVDQVNAVQEYLDQDELPSPKFKLHDASSMDKYTLDNFELIGYNPSRKIAIPVTV